MNDRIVKAIAACARTLTGAADAEAALANADTATTGGLRAFADRFAVRRRFHDPEVHERHRPQEAALQACYPAGAISIATPQYRVTVDSRGRAVEVELAESSGDETLDRAGECFLRTIRYAPTKAGNEKITSTAVIPVTLRPPKRSTSTPPPGP